jgi:hypothetical protein
MKKKKKNIDPLTNQSFFDSPISNQHIPSLVDGFVFCLYFQDFGNIEKNVSIFIQNTNVVAFNLSIYQSNNTNKTKHEQHQSI